MRRVRTSLARPLAGSEPQRHIIVTRRWPAYPERHLTPTRPHPKGEGASKESLCEHKGTALMESPKPKKEQVVVDEIGRWATTDPSDSAISECADPCALRHLA